MSMQVAHQLGAAKLPNPAAPANKITAEIGPCAWLPQTSRSPDTAIPKKAVLCRPRRRPKWETALSESHPPNNAIMLMVKNGAVPHKAPFVIDIPRTLVR